MTNERKRILWFVAMSAYFSLGYVAINFFSSGRQFGSLTLDIDRQLPFVPIFILVYAVGYPMPIIPYFVVRDLRMYKRTIMAFFFRPDRIVHHFSALPGGRDSARPEYHVRGLRHLVQMAADG